MVVLTVVRCWCKKGDKGLLRAKVSWSFKGSEATVGRSCLGRGGGLRVLKEEEDWFVGVGR